MRNNYQRHGVIFIQYLTPINLFHPQNLSVDNSDFNLPHVLFFWASRTLEEAEVGSSVLNLLSLYAAQDTLPRHRGQRTNVQPRCPPFVFSRPESPNLQLEHTCQWSLETENSKYDGRFTFCQWSPHC